MDDENDIPDYSTDEGDQSDPGIALDEGQPVGAQTMAPPIMLRGPQGPAAPSLAPRPTPPMTAPPPANPLSPEALANNMNWARLQYQLANTPIGEAEQAVAQALKFQALRQYQNDIAAGMAPDKALAKSAVQMFANPKQSNLGQAASFIRSTTPSAPKLIDVGGMLYRQNPDGSVTALTTGRPARRYNVGGVLYEQGPDGKMTAITPPKLPPGEKLSEADKALLGADVADLKATEKKVESTDEHGFGLFHPLGGNKSEMDALRKKAQDLRQKIQVQYGHGTRSATGNSEQITTKAQYDALPSGTVYVGKGGKRYRKP